MSSRPKRPVNPVAVALCLMLLAVGLGCIVAANAHAAYYKTLYCAAADGSGNPTLGARPGFFNFPDFCGTAYSDPPGDGGWLRLEENTNGIANYTDEASYSWSAPAGTSIAAVSAYTRVPGYFNSGWRSRFWGEGFDGSENNILMQGSGVANDGIFAPATSNFVYHAWPFGGFGDYKRLVFAMTCYRNPGGCSREGSNAADANGIAITLNDKEAARVNFEGESHLFAGDWVKGNNAIAWRESDQGSGLRFSRLGVDGAVLGDGTIDYQANGGCRTGYSDANGEFARDFTPCTQGPYLRYYGLETKNFSDGQHTLSICVQDFAQYQHIAGSATETCDRRTIHTDNTAPGKPASLEVTSANPQRYLDHFGAKFSLPPDPGSPIAKVHWDVVDSTGKVVMPEKVLSGTNPTVIPDIEGPAKPGAWTLRVWLEDSVGLIGPAAQAPIPHDTTPPAAPQNLSVTPPDTTRGADGFDVRWRNVLDAGSPVDAVHYRELNAAGAPVVSEQTIGGGNVQAIPDLDTPLQRGRYELEVWLSDAEGNVGVPSTVPLAWECQRSEVSGGNALSAGLGEKGASEEVVSQGSGSTLRGKLTGSSGAIADAPVCVFSRVVTDRSREFLGVAMSGADGGWQFAVPAGPSRELIAVHRSGSREVSARATLQTIVHPTFDAYRKVVYNKHSARFSGSIPGPHNNQVVVVLQVKRGNGWLAFHRSRTDEDGRFTLPYRFTRTDVPTKYPMRAQVRAQGGYPYLQGNSDLLTLIVLPRAPRRERCERAGRDRLPNARRRPTSCSAANRPPVRSRR